MEVGLLVYHFNHLGSTTAVTDESGKLVYAYDYGIYGELVSTTEYSQTKPIIRFLYDGQLGVATDDNSLYYMRSRYYNPQIKRFINQDVLIGSIANSNSLNRYSYVEGNPVSYTDPFGLSPFSFLNVFNPSMIVHTALDILGCLPGGAIFDVANAAIYFMEDNETEAWKCVFFAIPGADLVGKGAKWGAKLGGKGGKIVEQTMKTIDFAGHLGSTYFAASDFGNGIAFMIDKYMVGEAEFSSDTVWEFASLAGHGFQLRSFSGSFLNNAKAGNYGSTLMEASTTDLSLNSMFNYLVHDNSGFFNLDAKIDLSKNGTVPTKKYYQVTSKENAQTIINSSNPALKGTEFREVYVWTEQPTLKQAKNSGARYLDTVIEFETNATFSRDTSIVDSSLWNIAMVSDRPGPISISNVIEVGFKKEKRWWQFWKK